MTMGTSTTAITAATTTESQTEEHCQNSNEFHHDFIRTNIKQEITKQVIRQKLSKRRHLVLPQCLDVKYIQDLFFTHIVPKFQPQTVHYNGGVANVKEWKISCYLEVMPGGIPTAAPATPLRDCLLPLLTACNDLFLFWYKQQHSYTKTKRNVTSCHRLMSFITRYTAMNTDQSALLKHVDGAGKVDGSIVVALPTDEPFTGGGLTFWDPTTIRPDNGSGTNCNHSNNEIHYDPVAGDVTFIDRAVWHQADPITKGKRWALVIFYNVLDESS